jgi:surface protein
MKKILLLFIALFLTAQTIKAQTVVLDANGVTIKWTGTTVPNPRFVQASPRGTLEWFAIVSNGNGGDINDYARNIQSGITYFTPPGSSTPIPFNNIVTTLVTYMAYWLQGSDSFNQHIDSWDVSNVTNMSQMFEGANSFNQPISSWDVSNVVFMFKMFSGANSFNQPIGNWDVSNVIYLWYMFLNNTAFNQPIENWDVSRATDISYMFSGATAFNQPLGNWDVSRVGEMEGTFEDATAFNQPIGNWNVSSVVWMADMFSGATSFNQNIGNWNVSSVTKMYRMFENATSFNQPIGSWDVSTVTSMSEMFSGAYAFDQNIGSWNVSNVSTMAGMFDGAQLSTDNYDATLIGWSTIGPNETPLQPNVTFSGGNSNYCIGEAARNTLISTYGWTITDGGINCELSTETFDTTVLKLYPNPVTSVLNVKVDSNYRNEPYSIVDGLGRVVLNGNLKDVDTAINVEQLSKGIYYLKLADSNASKFIKN